MNQKQNPKITGLIFAMNEEKAGIEEFIQDKSITTLANRQFIQGNLWGHQVVCVLAGIGKVAAASTTALLLQQFQVNQLVLTGVAGAADEQLMVGDIIIADRLLQHDMNALPLFPRFEIPLLNKSYFASDPILNAQLLQAAQIYIENDFKKHVNQTLIDLFQLHKIKIKQGMIASGDQFISNAETLKELKNTLPDLLAVEMEGAAIAQVCHDFQIPFSILRTISDKANEEAHIDFQRFIRDIAAPYTLGILKEFFKA